MGHKLAIDLGTTNTVIARWNESASQPEVVRIAGMSTGDEDGRPSLVPSLIYVQDGKNGTVTIGQTIRDKGLDRQTDNRLFRNFKRGIVSAPAPDPRTIDDVLWGDKDVGRSFVRSLIEALPYKK